MNNLLLDFLWLILTFSLEPLTSLTVYSLEPSAVAASQIIRPATVIRQEHNREYSSSMAHPRFNQLVTMGYYLLATVCACHFRFGKGGALADEQRALLASSVAGRVNSLPASWEIGLQWWAEAHLCLLFIYLAADLVILRALNWVFFCFLDEAVPEWKEVKNQWLP